MGHTFGANAAAYAGDAGLPTGVNVFLDLEGVKNGVSASDVIDFCNAWFAEVEGVGYETGVYVGAAPGLTADQLYWNLRTKHYWKGGSSFRAEFLTIYCIADISSFSTFKIPVRPMNLTPT